MSTHIFSSGQPHNQGAEMSERTEPRNVSLRMVGRGGGIVVNIHAFYSNNLSSYPAGDLFVIFCTVL